MDKVSNIISSQSLARESTMSTEPVIKTSAESTRYETTQTGTQPTESTAVGDESITEPKKQLDANYGKLLREYNDLSEGYEALKKHLEDETKFHQEQTSQNAAVMADMQETINRLQSQLDDVLGGRPYSRVRTRRVWLCGELWCWVEIVVCVKKSIFFLSFSHFPFFLTSIPSFHPSHLFPSFPS